jgi:replicative DNA helicase
MISNIISRETQMKVLEDEKFYNYQGEDRIISHRDQAKEFDNLPTNVFKAETFFPYLNELVEGFEEGEVWVVSGKTKSGKSLLCQTLARDFSIKGLPSVFFNFEISPKQFLKRFNGDIPEHTYTPRRLKTAAMDWVEDRIKEAVVKKNIKVYFLDHLHYLIDLVQMQNSSIKIGSIVRQLKLMAIKHKVIVFLVAHTGKVPDGQEPTAENIRDSSLICQESDGTLMLWRLKDNNETDEQKRNLNNTMLRVEMTRRTGVYGKKIKLVKNERGLFGEVNWRE